MDGAGVSARWMRDQERHAISSARSNAKAFQANDECVALRVGKGAGDIGRGDLSHPSPMHLPLLEEAITTKLETFSKARPVLANRVDIIA